MKEDKYNEMGPNDELTNLIANRLAARQEKLEKMKAWDNNEHKKPGKSWMNTRVVSFAVAASLVAVFVFFHLTRVSPTAVDELGIDAPSLNGFRNASSDMTEIQNLMEKPDYSAALVAAEKALKHSDMEINEMKDVVYGDDEEEMYEEEMERQVNAQLRWTYIYLLVKNGNKDIAIKQLKRYLKNKEYCDNEEDARRLLQELKK